MMMIVNSSSVGLMITTYMDICLAIKLYWAFLLFDKQLSLLLKVVVVVFCVWVYEIGLFNFVGFLARVWNDKVVSLDLYSLFDQIKKFKNLFFLVVYLLLVPSNSFFSTFYLFLNDNANKFFSKKNIRCILD